jgi:hypothetical protein
VKASKKENQYSIVKERSRIRNGSAFIAYFFLVYSSQVFFIFLDVIGLALPGGFPVAL